MSAIKSAALLLGGVAILTQVVLLRALMAIFWGNELVVGLVLAFWMVFYAAGSLLGNHLPFQPILAGQKRQPVWPGLLLMGGALAGTLAGVALLPAARQLLSLPPAGHPGIHHLLVLAPFLLLPAAFPLGLAFTALTHAASRLDVNPAATVYIWEAAGSMLFSLLFYLLLQPRATPMQAVLLMAALLAAAAAARHRRRGLWLVVSAAVLLLAWQVPGFERSRAAAWWRSLSPGMTLRQLVRSPYAELAAVESGGALSLFANGARQTALPDLIPAQAQAALLMNQELPPGGEVLLIGGGLGGLAVEMARYPEAAVTCVEIDRQALALALEMLPDSLAAAWRQPRLRWRHDDGRHLLQRETNRYAMIVINVGRPSGALANRFYTAEFFALAASRLTPQGIFALLGVPGGENYLGPELLRLNSAIYRGLRDNFTRIVAIPGSEGIFLASNGTALSADPQRLSHRLLAAGLSLEYFYPPMFTPLLPAERLEEFERQLRSARPWQNRDFQPAVYFIDLLLWQKMTDGGGALLRRAEQIGYGPILALWGGLLLTGMFIAAWPGPGRRGSRDRPAPARRLRALRLAAFAAGVTGLALDVLFIMAMQNIFGTLYQSIGLALAAFMGGMAAGGWLTLRFIRQRRAALLTGLLLAAALLCAALTPLFIFFSRQPQPGLFYGAMIGCSMLAGALFPLLTALYVEAGGRGQGTIYAADLAGGAAGAMLISGFAVPLFGFARTLWMVALADMAAAGALILTARATRKEVSHDPADNGMFHLAATNQREQLYAERKGDAGGR